MNRGRWQREAMPSRPVPLPTRGEPVGSATGLGQVPLVIPTTRDIKAQGVRMADVLVFGPLMIYAGLGKATPAWLKVGMVIIGAGTVIYNLANYLTIEKEESGALGQMQAGPFHKAGDLHRPIRLVRQLHTNEIQR